MRMPKGKYWKMGEIGIDLKFQCIHIKHRTSIQMARRAKKKIQMGERISRKALGNIDYAKFWLWRFSVQISNLSWITFMVFCWVSRGRREFYNLWFQRSCVDRLWLVRSVQAKLGQQIHYRTSTSTILWFNQTLSICKPSILSQPHWSARISQYLNSNS